MVFVFKFEALTKIVANLIDVVLFVVSVYFPHQNYFHRFLTHDKNSNRGFQKMIKWFRFFFTRLNILDSYILMNLTNKKWLNLLPFSNNQTEKKKLNIPKTEKKYQIRSLHCNFFFQLAEGFEIMMLEMVDGPYFLKIKKKQH